MSWTSFISNYKKEHDTTIQKNRQIELVIGKRNFYIKLQAALFRLHFSAMHASCADTKVTNEKANNVGKHKKYKVCRMENFFAMPLLLWRSYERINWRKWKGRCQRFLLPAESSVYKNLDKVEWWGPLSQYHPKKMYWLVDNLVT